MPDDAEIAQQIAALFACRVGVGVTDPRKPQPDLMEGEDAHLGRAIPARKQEFAAGRTAARIAMAALGHAPVPIYASPNRSPRWPVPLHGSISHSQTLCVAVVTDASFAIGLDIEPATPLDPALLGEIVQHSAICADDPDALRHAKLIFCAKEAAFKAQFPLSQQHFGYDVMDITFEGATNNFEARFIKPVPPFAVGTTLLGRHTLLADHFATAVSIDLSHFERP